MFGVAWAFVAHTDSRFDTEMLCRFLRAYQDVQPLTIGELWAVAITLRIVLIENLRRIAEQIRRSSVARQAADDIADRLLGAGGRAAEAASVVLAASDGTTLADAFAVQLVHRLRDQDPRITPALTWLDRHLAAQGTTADAVVRDEHQRQGAGTVTVRNIITSMRLISDVDWTELFERVSLADDALASGSAFRAMDFPTRNLYRSAIEELARGANRTELEIARRCCPGGKAGRWCACRGGGGSPQRSRLPPARWRAPRVRGGDRLSARHCARGLDASAGGSASAGMWAPASRLPRSCWPYRCGSCMRTGSAPRG